MRAEACCLKRAAKSVTPPVSARGGKLAEKFKPDALAVMGATVALLDITLPGV